MVRGNAQTRLAGKGRGLDVHSAVLAVKSWSVIERVHTHLHSLPDLNAWRVPETPGIFHSCIVECFVVQYVLGIPWEIEGTQIIQLHSSSIVPVYILKIVLYEVMIRHQTQSKDTEALFCPFFALFSISCQTS